MALARLITKNAGLGFGRRVSPIAISERGGVGSAAFQQIYGSYSSASAADGKPDGGSSEVAVTEEDRGKKKSELRKRRQGGSLWKNRRGDFVPSLHDFFPSSLGSALMQATNNINKLLNNFAPSRLIGRVREKDDCYKAKFHLPGIRKEDLKVTVEDGILRIVGEHKEEEEDETESSEDEEHWAARGFYGYYDSTLVLPDDAKVDEIKAEMKHGVLTVVIPKSESVKKDVKEIEIN